MQWNTLVTANIQLLVGEMMVVEVRVMVRVVEVVEVVVAKNIDWRVALESGRHSSS